MREATNMFPRHVFVIEDDHAYEVVLKNVLHSIDPKIRIDYVGSAEQAFARLAQALDEGKNYDLIIADIFLNGEKTGIDLWEVCQQQLSEIPLLLISGLPTNRFLEVIGRNSIMPPFLEKPFMAGECRQVIEGLLQYSHRAA